MLAFAVIAVAAAATPPVATADPVAAFREIADFGARKQWLTQWVHAQNDPDRLIAGATAMKVLDELEKQHRTDAFVVLAFTAAALDPATSTSALDLARRGGDPPIVGALTSAPPGPTDLADSPVFHAYQLTGLVQQPAPRWPGTPAGQKATCKVRVFLGADGAPRDVVNKECPTIFFDAARQAVSQWTWAPPQMNGAPTAAQVVLTLDVVSDATAPPPAVIGDPVALAAYSHQMLYTQSSTNVYGGDGGSFSRRFVGPYRDGALLAPPDYFTTVGDDRAARRWRARRTRDYALATGLMVGGVGVMFGGLAAPDEAQVPMVGIGGGVALVAMIPVYDVMFLPTRYGSPARMREAIDAYNKALRERLGLTPAETLALDMAQH